MYFAITSSTNNKEVNTRSQVIRLVNHQRSIVDGSCSSYSHYNSPLSRECLSQIWAIKLDRVTAFLMEGAG